MKQYLTIKNWFIIFSILHLIGGVTLTLIPENVLSSVSIVLDAGGVYVAQGRGFLNLMIAIILWFARNEGPSNARKGIMYGEFVGWSIGLIIEILAYSSGLVNTPFYVILAVVVSIGWGYFAFFLKPVCEINT